MGSLRETIVSHVDEQLHSMFATPGMWGSDESVELQALQLLQVRSVSIRPDFEKNNPGHVLDSFHRFLKTEFPGAPSHPLFCLVEELHRQREFIPLLRKFCEQIQSEMDSSDALMEHDLVLRIWLREDERTRMPRASILSTYYTSFKNVLRAVSRRTGTRGQSSHALEEAIDFVMPDVIVNPANGAPANILLPLEQLPSAKVDDVRKGIEKLVTVNEWAAEPGGSVESLMGRLGEDPPEKIAAQALRLMPENAVQAVELGGKLVGRLHPVVIRPQYAERMVKAVKHGSETQPFDRMGIIRAIDIDQRSMRIRVGRKSVKCWLEGDDLVKKALKAAEREVQIVGQLYKTSSDAEVVIVQSIG